jgi:hypothetical protein
MPLAAAQLVGELLLYFVCSWLAIFCLHELSFEVTSFE